MTVSIGDGLIWIDLSQLLAISLAIDVVFSTTVAYEVGSLMNKCSTLGIGPSSGGAPEGIAEVDGSEFIGI